MVVDEAIGWIGTPWHHMARVKGHGVDCAQFLIGVYSNVGLIESFETEYYPHDWMMHQDEPRFINQLKRFCYQVEAPLLGDVAMFRVGRLAAHGAIVVADDRIVHAYLTEGRVTLSGIINTPLQKILVGYWRWKGFIQWD